MDLRLNCRFSYISKYNKMVFVANDDTSKDKLTTHCGISNDEFNVSMPRPLHITDDIREMVGLDCVIHVRAKPYKFVSKLEKNYGETVQGMSLTLLNIERKYSDA